MGWPSMAAKCRYSGTPPIDRLCPGERQRYRQDGVGPQAGLVGRAVQVEQRSIERRLIVQRPAPKPPANLPVDMADGLEAAQAGVAGRIAVAEFEGLGSAGRGPAGHRCAGRGAAGQPAGGANGGASAAVENFQAQKS